MKIIAARKRAQRLRLDQLEVGPVHSLSPRGSASRHCLWNATAASVADWESRADSGGTAPGGSCRLSAHHRIGCEEAGDHSSRIIRGPGVDHPSWTIHRCRLHWPRGDLNEPVSQDVINPPFFDSSGVPRTGWGGPARPGNNTTVAAAVTLCWTGTTAAGMCRCRGSAMAPLTAPATRVWSGISTRFTTPVSNREIGWARIKPPLRAEDLGIA